MDEFSENELEQLMAVYREQTLHILDEMCQDLLSLESHVNDDEVIGRLRRAAHTIKGDSACVGLERIAELSHWIEEVFDRSDCQNRGLGENWVDLILRCTDWMKEAVSRDQIEDLPEECLKIMVELIDAADSTEVAATREFRGVLEEPRTESDPSGGLPGGIRRNVSREELAGREKEGYVRVKAARLDGLMNLAGEMVIARSSLNELVAQLERTIPKDDLVGRLSSASLRMAKLVTQFQKNILKMRLATIDLVFRRFLRPMRELAVESRKQVQLNISGGETELDRALVDLLYEPLLHLLRNAIDHGIEPLEERVIAGKPATGSISLKAFHEGNQVAIEVTDDGRGIDKEGLKRRAIESSSLSLQEAEAMTEEQVLDLLFLERVSTASEVTRVSGRGIGAAAAKSCVEQLRGTISVSSKEGSGTTFLIRMPLTLAIIRALLFSGGGQLFGLPLLAVSEIVKASSSEIVRLDGFESYRLRDKFISLVRPGQVLGFDRRKGGAGLALRGASRSFFIIVVITSGRKYGLIVEEVHGDQELVIKPLESKWVENEVLTGASILGDGRVALIIDSGMMLKRAIRYERSKGIGEVAYG